MAETLNISIIIPTYNEESTIQHLVSFLHENGKNHISEIIISDGGSNDNTLIKAQNSGAIALKAPQKGRAFQMDYGASFSTGNILYFVHADTIPPASFVDDISDAFHKGYDFGRFRTQFNSSSLLLKINAFFTRFDWFICYGGDQSLFINKDFYQRINGFNTSMKIMEDYEVVTRGKQYGNYIVIQKDTLVSARKYNKNSWIRVLCTHLKIVKMYKKGASQEDLISTYQSRLDLSTFERNHNHVQKNKQ